MRDIKFRCYVKFLGEIHNVNELRCNGNVMTDGYDYCLDKDDIVLMQYTGIDDKNGTPIFEGDIVEGICLGFCDDDEFKDVVEWGNGSFCFRKEKWKDGTYDWYSLENYDSEDLVIVGNIYENPDML